MKIKNVHLKSIEARRYSKDLGRPPQIRIDHNSSVIQFQSVKTNEASIDFSYTATYGPLGMIKLEGNMIYEGSDARKLSQAWEETKKMPNEIASRIHTTIMHLCVPEAVGIAKELHLPPPIPLPQVKIGKEGKKIEPGPEFA